MSLKKCDGRTTRLDACGQQALVPRRGVSPYGLRTSKVESKIFVVILFNEVRVDNNTCGDELNVGVRGRKIWVEKEKP